MLLYFAPICSRCCRLSLLLLRGGFCTTRIRLYLCVCLYLTIFLFVYVCVYVSLYILCIHKETQGHTDMQTHQHADTQTCTGKARYHLSNAPPHTRPYMLPSKGTMAIYILYHRTLAEPCCKGSVQLAKRLTIRTYFQGYRVTLMVTGMGSVTPILPLRIYSKLLEESQDPIAPHIFQNRKKCETA